MKKRKHITGYLCGWALALVSLAPAAMAQSVAPRQNGKIAFVIGGISSTSGIWVVNPDGSDRRQLTVGRYEERYWNPAWSPDGTQIAFVKIIPRGQWSPEIWLMNADGSNQRRLTQPGVGSWPKPAWSPDGARIAFTGEIGSLYVMNADGSNQTVIGEGWSPSWSPDGSKLVVTDAGGMYILNADGSGRTPLALPRNLSTDYDWGPVWSPDGSRIAFARSVNCDCCGDCDSTTIWAVNPNGTNLTRVCDMEDYGHNWSPDGTKIVFASPANHSLDLFVMNADGSGITNITNSEGLEEDVPAWQLVALQPQPGGNPIDGPSFFVRQQYLDFLNREPDAPGLDHWAGEITACDDPSRRQAGESLALCIERKRPSTSAAFFLSPEFQYTGYFVYRLYKGSLITNGTGRPPTYQEFLRDVRQVASGIIQNNQLSAAAIEGNKKTFAEEFTKRAEFRSLYDPLSNFDYVERLFQTTGINVNAQEKQALVDGLNNQTETRASVLQKVVDGTLVIAEGNQQFTTAYGRAFYEKEFNPAFVLMEYFGYLHRDPDAPGYQHWLDKLNLYHNYIDAEMVKSFITSPEYRARFGQP